MMVMLVVAGPSGGGDCRKSCNTEISVFGIGSDLTTNVVAGFGILHV
jgi:hypothetical protein